MTIDKRTLPKIQTPRREIAREMKRSGMTYQEIGNVMGISRQRAQQLVQVPDKELHAIKSKSDGHCDDCGQLTEKLDAHHDNYEGAPTRLLCVACHRKADSKNLPRYQEHFQKRKTLSGYTGVHFHKRSRLYQAEISSKSLGYFKNPEEAARAYDDALLASHPKWVTRLNFPKAA